MKKEHLVYHSDWVSAVESAKNADKFIPEFTILLVADILNGPTTKYIAHKSGATAEIYQHGQSWLTRNLTGADNLTEKRKEGLLKRMGEWYYHTQVKK